MAFGDLVQVKVGSDAYDDTSLSFDSLPSVGNLVYAILLQRGGEPNNDAATLSDNQSNTWATALIAQSRTTPRDYSVAVSSAVVATSSGTFTISAAAGDTNTKLIIAEFDSGGRTVSLDQSASATPASGALTVTTGATDTADELVIATYIPRTGGSMPTASYPSGYTDLYYITPQIFPAAGAYKTVSSTGTQSVTWPDYFSGADIQGGTLQTFRGPTGGGFEPAWARGCNTLIGATP